MLLAAIGELMHPTSCQKMIGRTAFCITLPFQIVAQAQKISSDFSAFSTKTAVVKASFCPFLHPVSVCWSTFWLFCTLHIIALALRFATFHPAFWCILHCVLVHFALRSGAKWSVFCRILPCVLVLFTPYFAANSAVWRTECIFKQRQAVIYPPLYAPCFAPNKLAQYSQKCERMEGLLEKMQP